MLKKDMDSVIDLFDWSAVELNKIRKLAASTQRQSDEEKKYRHSCYRFEMAYALEMKPRRDVSSNPGCE